MKRTGLFIEISVLSAFLLLQIFFFFIKKHDCLDLDVYPNTTPTYFICGSYSIGQTFLASRNNLTRIDVMMGTYGRTNAHKIYFQLLEVSGKRKILRREVSFPASSVKNNLYHEIRFRPISDSKGKIFYFVLTSPESTLENAFSAWMNEKNIYRHGNFVFDGRVGHGDLIFRAYSRQNVFSSLGRVVRKYPGILGNKYFFYLTVIIFEALSFLMLHALLQLFLNSLLGLNHSGALSSKGE